MSKPAAALGWGFAIVAAAASATYASSIYPADPYVSAFLIAISVGAVAYERYALVLSRKNREAKDRTALSWGFVLLVAACLYTASMQFGFFADLVLKPVAADQGHTQMLTDASRKVAELEQRRGWLEKPNGTAESLNELIEALKDSKVPKDRDAVREARKDLAAAKALDKLDADLGTARAELAKLKAAPPSDSKGAVIEGLTFGAIKAEWVSYALVVLSVAVLQAFQILLPIISGEGRPKESRADHVSKQHDPFPGDRPVSARRVEDTLDLPVAPKAKRIDAQPAPKQIAAQAPQSAVKPHQQIALPPPRKGGLAARIKAAG